MAAFRSHKRRRSQVMDECTEDLQPRKRLKVSHTYSASPNRNHNHNHNGHHNHNHNSNHNYNARARAHGHSRVYRHHDDFSQSQSETDNDEDSNDNDGEHHAEQKQIYRAMSQVVYQNKEEIEFEFKQCLKLYDLTASAKKNKQSATNNNTLSVSYTMSQVVPGRYGDRNRQRNSNRSVRRKFISRSKNNPFDRKMIDFLQSIPCIERIEHYHQRQHTCSPSISPTLSTSSAVPQTAPKTEDWVMAGQAINACAHVYVHRVKVLGQMVDRFMSTVLVSANRAALDAEREELGNADQHENSIGAAHRRSVARRRNKTYSVSASESEKINQIVPFGEIETRYEMDSFHIIRQRSHLFMSSTQWWQDRSAPWLHNDNDREEARDFAQMLMNDDHELEFSLSDLHCTHVLDRQATNFFGLDHAHNDNQDRNQQQVPNQQRNAESQEVDDATTISHVSEMDSNRSQRRRDANHSADELQLPLPEIPLTFTPLREQSVTDSLIILNQDATSNEIQTTPIVNITPPIIGSVIEFRRSDSGQRSQSDSVQSRLSRFATAEQRKSNEDEEKEIEYHSNDSMSTFNSDKAAQHEKSDASDHEQAAAVVHDKNDEDDRSESQAPKFRLPPLRRLTRQNCDMSLMPNLLMDGSEDMMDAFIIDKRKPSSLRNACTPRRRRRSRPVIIRNANGMRRTAKRNPRKRSKKVRDKENKDDGDEKEKHQEGSPPKKRKVVRNESCKEVISNDLDDKDKDKESDDRSPGSVQSTPSRNQIIGYNDDMSNVPSMSSVEFPRGFLSNGIEYEHRMPVFPPFPGPATFPDDYNLEPIGHDMLDPNHNHNHHHNHHAMNPSMTASSTPRTSASVPLLTPPTMHSGMPFDTMSRHHKKSKSVLSGVQEMSGDINVELSSNQAQQSEFSVSPSQIQFGEHKQEEISVIEPSPSPPVQIATQQARRGNSIMQDLERTKRTYENIRFLNQSTHKIVNEDEDGVTFSSLVQRQQHELQDALPDLSVAMSFLSLLTVCSDSYHGHRSNDRITDIRLERDSEDNADFNIRVIRD